MSVLITGASSGIGKACAEVFAREGNDLILIARRGERLAQIKADLLTKKIKNKGPISIDLANLDIRDRKALENFALHQAELLDTVDVLINNAGLAKGLSQLQSGNLDDWDTMIDTNIKGLLYVTRLVVPKMIAQGRGHIINIGSVAGRWVYPKGNPYCASKFAVRALTEGLRLDLNGTGIRVTEIAPGKVETEFSQVRLGDLEKAKAVYQNMTPLSPQDIAESILWCAERPAHVNIQELVIFPTDQASVYS